MPWDTAGGSFVDEVSDKDFRKNKKDGGILVAAEQMPGVFEKSVILIVKHNSDGALGLIINKPSTSVKIDDILNFHNQDATFKEPSMIGKYAWFGGPVHDPGTFHAIMR